MKSFSIVTAITILSDKSFSVSQKIRWLALFVKATRKRKFIISNGQNICLPMLVNAIISKTAAFNPVILDIGANVGLFTKAFATAKKKPQKILALEPSSYVFSILKIVTSKIPNVLVRQLALNYEEGMVQLKTPMKTSGSLRVGLSHIGTINNTRHYLESVPAKRLDDVLFEEKIQHVDVVKIDVEGAEEQVIQGAQALLKKIKPIWFVELAQGRADNVGGSAQRIFRVFTEAGYEAFILNESYDWVEVKELSDAYDYLFVPTSTVK